METLPFTTAFRAAEAPIVTSCAFCGAEILFGALTTRLEAEVGLCSACPPSFADCDALFSGALAGIETAKGTNEHLGIWSNPYRIGTTTYEIWKRGWWAGLFCCEEDPKLFRKRLDIGLARS